MPLLVLCQAVHSFHLLMLDTANRFASLVYYFYLIVLGSSCCMSKSVHLKMQVLILVSGGWLCLEKPFNSQCVLQLWMLSVQSWKMSKAQSCCDHYGVVSVN